MQVDNLMELIQRDEALHPDLTPWLMQYTRGPMAGTVYLNAPLVQEMLFNPKKCALINARYKHKTEALERAVKEKDAHSYIWLHERPYRLDAFQTYLDLVKVSDKTFWKLVEAIWTDSENIWQHKKTWSKLWNSTRKDKRRIMRANERRLFAMLPDPIDVYRGLNRDQHDRKGMSWTIDPKKGAWFAHRYSSDGKVLKGVVEKKNVHALLLGRNEFEIVAEKVTILSAQKVPKMERENVDG